MNATVDNQTLAHALEAMDPRNRRGPFRPEKLVSVRERRSGDMFVRLFRTIDSLVLLGLTAICLSPMAHTGLFAAPAGDLLPFVTGGLIIYFLLGATGIYRFGRKESQPKHIAKLAAVFCAAAVVALVTCAVAPHGEAASEAVGIWLLSTFACFVTIHLIWSSLVARWRREGKLTPSIVIVGATKHAEKLIETAIAEQHVNILGIFDDRLARNPQAVGGVPVLGDVKALLTHKITPYVDQIVVALDTSAKARVNTIVEKLRALPNEVSLFLDVENEQDGRAAWSRIADMPLARVSGRSEDERKAMIKRAQDLIVGTVALIVFSPIMLVTALLIKLDSPGPVFFRQRRHGFNNEAIMVWKFRSMHTHMTDHTAAQQVQKDDPRVTRVGRIIRKTSIDELPQLFNVLIGEMSLVGPRPHAIGMKTEGDESEKIVAEYAWRHRMKPGVTGWAAIKGSRGALETADDVRRRIAFDVEYIDRQSLWLDLYIMAVTVPCLLGDAKATR